MEDVDWLMMLPSRCGVFSQSAAAESDCRSDDWSAGDGGGAELQHVVINCRHHGRFRMYVLVTSVVLLLNTTQYSSLNENEFREFTDL